MGAPPAPPPQAAPVQKSEAPAATLPRIAASDAQAPVASTSAAAPAAKLSSREPKPDSAMAPAAPKPEAAAKAEPTARPDSAPRAEPTPKPESAPRAEPAARSEPPKAAPRAASTAKPATQPKTEAKPAPPTVADARPAPDPKPVTEAKPVIEAKPMTEAKAAPQAKAAAPLDLKSLEQRLKDTHAIGIMTKLSLKNQVDDLIEKFREYHRGASKVALAELRRPYELLLMKVLSLLQDGDPALAQAINTSREAIWEVLADREKFQQFA